MQSVKHLKQEHEEIIQKLTDEHATTVQSLELVVSDLKSAQISQQQRESELAVANQQLRDINKQFEEKEEAQLATELMTLKQSSGQLETCNVKLNEEIQSITAQLFSTKAELETLAKAAAAASASALAAVSDSSQTSSLSLTESQSQSQLELEYFWMNEAASKDAQYSTLNAEMEMAMAIKNSKVDELQTTIERLQMEKKAMEKAAELQVQDNATAIQRQGSVTSASTS